METVPDWAAPSVAVLTGLGLVGGYEDGSIRGNGTVRRSEAAKILAGLY